MQISRIVWSEVVVRCPSDPSHDEVFQQATLTFNPQIKSLEVREETTAHHPKSALYARAKFVSLTPDSVEFTANWWSSKLDSDEMTMVPVTVTAVF